MNPLFFSRRVAPGSLASLILLVAFSGASARATVSSLTAKTVTKVVGKTAVPDKRVAVFEQVWSTINQNYYDPKFNGVNWRAMHDKYLPQARKAANEADFYDVLDAMIGELHDRHTSVTPPAVQRQTDDGQETSVGLRLSLVEGVLVVWQVDPGSDAARRGIRPGMKVKTIEGQPVQDAAKRRLYYSRLLFGEPGTRLHMDLVRAGGKSFHVSLLRRLVDTPDPVFEARLLRSGDAYIKFGEWIPPVDAQIKAALQRFKNAPALILDLRDNPGGQLNIEQGVASYFFNREINVGKRLTRTGKPMSLLYGFIQFPNEMKIGRPGGQIYRHPVAILVNRRSASASEAFSNLLQEQGRATVVGTRSSGSLLGIHGATRLKDGGELRVSELGFLSSKGQRVEGRGVIPDVPVAITLADLRRGRDATVEAAEAYFAALRLKPSASHLKTAPISAPISAPTPVPTPVPTAAATKSVTSP